MIDKMFSLKDKIKREAVKPAKVVEKPKAKVGKTKKEKTK